MPEPTSSSESQAGDPTGREVYNVVTDTVTGVNVRWWDNLLQAVVGAVCFVLGASLGWLVAFVKGGDQLMGGLLGAFLGLTIALVGSGAFLMVFRFVRHLRGKHD